MDAKAYWLWLQHAFPAGSSKPKSIYNRYDSLEEFYRGGATAWSRMSFINAKELSLLTKYSLSQAEAVMEYCYKTGKEIICPEDSLYPASLFEIKDPPSVLFYKGKFPEFEKKLSIAVVGSRKASDLSLEIAETITYKLSKEGVIVVSGGALGVDTAAHKGALRGFSPTVAVLGCGLDFPYLMENECLRDRILSKGGALITEYPPSMGVLKGTFQARNRIISALCEGTLIVSAEKKSGSMITARRALEQNRDIFAVPGNPMLPTSEGPNSLIKDGATPVTCCEDILSFYSGNIKLKNKKEKKDTSQVTFTNLLNKTDSEKEIKEASINKDPNNDPIEKFIRNYSVSRNSATVLRALSLSPMHISELMEKTKLSSSEILSSVTELELFDVVISYSGQRYALKEIL